MICINCKYAYGWQYAKNKAPLFICNPTALKCAKIRSIHKCAKKKSKIYTYPFSYRIKKLFAEHLSQKGLPAPGRLLWDFQIMPYMWNMPNGPNIRTANSQLMLPPVSKVGLHTYQCEICKYTSTRCTIFIRVTYNIMLNIVGYYFAY